VRAARPNEDQTLWRRCTAAPPHAACTRRTLFAPLPLRASNTYRARSFEPWCAHPRACTDLYDPHLDIDLSAYTGNFTLPNGTHAFTRPSIQEANRYGPHAHTPWPWPPSRDYDRVSFARDEMRHLIHGYMACVSYVDAQVGLVLDALDDPDGDPATDDALTNSTAVVFTSQ
jgi:arylsulfatase A-like enzyme